MNPNRADGGARPARPAGTAAPAGSAECSYLITRLHHALRRALDDRLRELGFNTAQYVVMRELGAEPTLSAATLAKRASLRPQATAPVIASLEERGFVGRSPHRYNRRVREVRLTPAGREALADCSRRLQEVEERLLAGFGAAEGEAFRLSLEACLANMDPPWYQQEAAKAGHGAAGHGPAPGPGAPAGAGPAGDGVPSDSPPGISQDLLAMVLAAARDPGSPLSAAAPRAGAARRLIQYVDRDLARPMAARIDADRPELRAEMAAALLVGISVLGTAAGPASGAAALARAPDADITELFDRAFQALTAGAPLHGGEDAPPSARLPDDQE